MVTYTDSALVENLLKDAIGYGSTPELSEAQIGRMVALAEIDGATTSEGLQRAASAAWAWKAGLTADKYMLRAASGAQLDQGTWWEHCMAMAHAYATGGLSVDGLTLGSDLNSGAWGVVTVTSPFLTDAWWETAT